MKWEVKRGVLTLYLMYELPFSTPDFIFSHFGKK